MEDRLNTEFLNMMEQYYVRTLAHSLPAPVHAPQAQLLVSLCVLSLLQDQGPELRSEDARPEVHYQVGVTPENVERARNHCERMKGLNSTEKPLTEVHTTRKAECFDEQKTRRHRDARCSQPSVARTS